MHTSATIARCSADSCPMAATTACSVNSLSTTTRPSGPGMPSMASMSTTSPRTLLALSRSSQMFCAMRYIHESSRVPGCQRSIRDKARRQASWTRSSPCSVLPVSAYANRRRRGRTATIRTRMSSLTRRLPGTLQPGTLQQRARTLPIPRRRVRPRAAIPLLSLSACARCPGSCPGPG